MLMSLPAEILEAIVKEVVGGEATLTLDIRDQKSTLTWSPEWLPGLLLVGRTFSGCAKPIIASNVTLEYAERDRFRQVYQNLLPGNEEGEHVLRVDGFPQYIQERTPRLIVSQSKTQAMLCTDMLDVSAFPKLESLVLYAGRFEVMWSVFSSQVYTQPLSAWIERKFYLVKDVLVDQHVLTDEQLLSVRRGFRDTFEHGRQFGLARVLFNAAVGARLRFGKDTVMRFFERFTAEILHCSNQSIIGLPEETETHVSMSTGEFSGERHTVSVVVKLGIETY